MEASVHKITNLETIDCISKLWTAGVGIPHDRALCVDVHVDIRTVKSQHSLRLLAHDVYWRSLDGGGLFGHGVKSTLSGA